jgi:hypothetical protein
MMVTKRRLQIRILLKCLVILVVGLLLSPAYADAISLTVNEIIYSSEGGTDFTMLSGSVEADISDGSNILTITLKNTSQDASSEDASQLLSGVGITLGAGFDILSGSVTMNGSTAYNFVQPSDNDVSGEWGYDNLPLKGGWDAAFSGIDTGVSTRVSSSDSAFSNNVIAPPGTLGGPEFGLWSKSYSTNPGGLNAIEDMVSITLNLSANVIDSAGFLNTLESGSTVLMFGSPDSSTVPEPSTMLLFGAAGLGWMGAWRWRARR